MYDVLIIGGGINGTAIARDAARGGAKVLLVERDDLASHTSSASTKLIHGGLRYLEYYEFGMVRESLRERERLLRLAPHLIYPLRFVLPHAHSVRPWWLVRAGLLLYDTIGGRSSLPRARSLRRDDTAYRAPLKAAGRGFVYSDAWVDDARFVVLNAIDAARHGAEVRTRTALVSARREDNRWRATLSDGVQVTARMLVNAAGPWVSEVQALTGINARAGTRLVKGSHIVVPKLFEGNHAYMLQQPDRRVVFAIAYAGDKTLIGTTDIAVDKPEDGRIGNDEIDYLCAAANRYFSATTTPADVVATFSGVRPLYDDGASEAKAVTRDYVLELHAGGAPLLGVFGGKVTTARHLAEEATAKLGLPSGKTRDARYPGGDIDDFAAFLATIRERYSWLGDDRSYRMARAYGTMLHDFVRRDMGEEFGGGLTAVEVDWLRDHEWAHTAQDVLWRRTKLRLVLTPPQVDRLTAYLGEA